MGMQNAVTLANNLVDELRKDRTMDQQQITHAFRKYQEKRKAGSKSVVRFCGIFTRVNAHDGYWNTLAAMLASFVENLPDGASQIAFRGAKLSYVPFEQKVGSWGWKDTPGSFTVRLVHQRLLSHSIVTRRIRLRRRRVSLDTGSQALL
jgi:2-polyprenyl-6-methoxyphenol hydroxylase-like FAD-dependent oxidoreductase